MYVRGLVSVREYLLSSVLAALQVDSGVVLK